MFYICIVNQLKLFVMSYFLTFIGFVLLVGGNPIGILPLFVGAFNIFE